MWIVKLETEAQMALLKLQCQVRPLRGSFVFVLARRAAQEGTSRLVFSVW